MNTQEATQAVSQWKPLLLNICNEYGRYHPWLHDDFVSDAYLAVWKDFLKPTRPAWDITGKLVATIVTRAIWGRLAHERAKNRVAFQPQPNGTKRQRLLSLIRAHDIDLDVRLDAETILGSLTRTNRTVLMEWFGGRTHAAIARNRGVTTQAVQCMVQGVLRRLRERHFES